MAENFANDPTTTLSAAVTTTSQTAWTVTSSTGFPAVPFRAKIGSEIVLVTAVSGTSWTVTRAQESTTASTYILGTTVTHVVTAAALTNFAQKDQAGTWTATQTFAGITATSASVSGQAVVVTNDSRLSDARTPTAHAASHALGGSDQILALCPVGAILMWPTATPPTGWLICNGQATTGFTALAALIGANVPDYRGLFPIGVNSANTLFDVVLESGGSATIAAAELPTHAHSLNAHTHGSTGAPSDNTSDWGGVDHSHTGYATYTSVNHSHGTGSGDTTHTHSEVSNSGNAVFYTGGGTGMDGNQWSQTSQNWGNHTHGSTGYVSSWHDHSVSTSTSSAYVHQHTMKNHTHGVGTAPTPSTTATDGGSGTAHYPPYRAINFIIKT